MQSFRTVTLQSGTLSGLAVFAFFIALYQAGYDPLGRASWWGAWIPVVFIAWSTRRVRERALGGAITYWSAFKAGVLTAFFGSLLFALLVYVCGRLVFPGLLERHKAALLEDMEAARLFFSDDFYEKGVESIEQLTLAAAAYNDFTLKMLGGTAVSFITAAFFRTTRPPEP
jgi:hypothetical protein